MLVFGWFIGALAAAWASLTEVKAATPTTRQNAKTKPNSKFRDGGAGGNGTFPPALFTCSAPFRSPHGSRHPNRHPRPPRPVSPWSRFHLLLVVALGATWVLDGLEVTLVGSIAPILQDKRTLGLSPQDIGTVASAYVAGAVIGALVFGWLTDRFGRRQIFNITLAIYVLGVLAHRMLLERLVVRRLPRADWPGHRR